MHKFDRTLVFPEILRLENVSILGRLSQSTAGDDGSVGIISCMSIFSACFVLLTSRQLAATTWSGQIWISGWILPHFDVRTISVAKEVIKYFLTKNIFPTAPSW